MAKTDKTRPIRVKARDKASYLIADHDHRHGTCDLPATPELYAGEHCSWLPSADFTHRRENDCGCPHCTDQIARKAKARRERSNARLAVRRWRDTLV